jgi:hypothetical protein
MIGGSMTSNDKWDRLAKEAREFGCRKLPQNSEA